jgi:hypothetical protein
LPLIIYSSLYLYHKTITGELSIYQDDSAGATGNSNLPFTNNNPLVIGGNTFIGNMLIYAYGIKL